MRFYEGGQGMAKELAGQPPEGGRAQSRSRVPATVDLTEGGVSVQGSSVSLAEPASSSMCVPTKRRIALNMPNTPHVWPVVCVLQQDNSRAKASQKGKYHVGSEAMCLGVTWWCAERPMAREYDAVCQRCWPKRPLVKVLVPKATRLINWNSVLCRKQGGVANWMRYIIFMSFVCHPEAQTGCACRVKFLHCVSGLVLNFCWFE